MAVNVYGVGGANTINKDIVFFYYLNFYNKTGLPASKKIINEPLAFIKVGGSFLCSANIHANITYSNYK